MGDEIRQRGTEQARLDLRAPVPVGQSLLEELESIGSERPDSFLAMRGLHMLHLNVRSLLPKITEIRHLSKSRKVGIFCFTETWLDDYVKDAET